MAHIFMQHQVADYDAWRPIFDGDASNLAAAGVTSLCFATRPTRTRSGWSPKATRRSSSR